MVNRRRPVSDTVTDHPTPTTDDSNRPIQLSGEAALDALCADTDRVLVELYRRSRPSASGSYGNRRFP